MMREREREREMISWLRPVLCCSTSLVCSYLRLGGWYSVALSDQVTQLCEAGWRNRMLELSAWLWSPSPTFSLVELSLTVLRAMKRFVSEKHWQVRSYEASSSCNFCFVLVMEDQILKKYNITQDDFNLFEEVVLLYKPYKAGMPWQFAGSFYYATTVLTTIGRI